MSSDEDFAELGVEGMRQFLASCDPEDLRLGDMHRAMSEYRRAVMAQGGLGIPNGDDSRTNGGGIGEGGCKDESGGRFIHASPESLRVGDVPAMLAELQGALIAIAPAQGEGY